MWSLNQPPLYIKRFQKFKLNYKLNILAKEIYYGKDAFEKLKQGASAIADVVGVTMGAKGRNVLIEDVYGNDPHVTKDGITVAKAVALKDPVEKIAANLLKKISLRTNDKVGDGSSSSLVLGNAIVQYGATALEQGANPVQLKRGIDIEMHNTLEYLEAMKTPIENMEMARDVALVSANGDEEIADLVTKVYELVGKEGNVAIELDGNSPSSSFNRVEGIEFDRGFNNPYFITDLATETVEYTNPLILISDYRINDIKDVVSVLKLIQEIGKPLLIICEDIDPQADNLLAVNKMQNGLPVVTVNAPEFGDRRLNFLEDLAVLTGGKFVSTVTGMTFDDVKEEHFGTADKITVTRDTTSIIGGKGDPEVIEKRVAGIKEQILASSESDEDHKTNLEKRYAKVKGGFVVIKVGGYSEVERREKKDRVEDAVNAVKSALIDGIVPGGGSALLRISNTALPEADLDFSSDVVKGRQVLKQSLAVPFRQILVNAGYNPSQIKGVEEALMMNPNLNWVLDVNTDEYVDSIKKGIIDPVLVTKTALTNAASIAGTLLTTGATISFENESDGDLKV